MASDPAAVTRLYEQIPLESMTQVSDSYMAWYVDRVTRQLDDTTAGLRAELRENDAKEASYCPTPREQEAIERLKRSGVSGMDLLDRMVEQGEDWITLTMRRLDHFERTGLAPKDYSTWCEHALSGAYDWIDHERINQASGGVPATSGSGSRPAAAPSANVPDWMANRGNRPEEAPTAPVPSVQPGYGSNYYGGANGGAPAAGQPAAAGQRPAGPGQQSPDDSDGKGRNIFRIFTN
jgi:hypothetical protein